MQLTYIPAFPTGAFPRVRSHWCRRATSRSGGGEQCLASARLQTKNNPKSKSKSKSKIPNPKGKRCVPQFVNGQGSEPAGSATPYRVPSTTSYRVASYRVASREYPCEGPRLLVIRLLVGSMFSCFDVCSMVLRDYAPRTCTVSC